MKYYKISCLIMAVLSAIIFFTTLFYALSGENLFKTPLTAVLLVVFGVLTFISLYLVCLLFGTLALSFCDLDFVTCFSGAISALSNIGPALGNEIGPDKTFAFLPSSALFILSFLMILGRLEFVAILILFFPFFWKKNI